VRYADRTAAAQVDQAEIVVIDLQRADDVRSDREDDFVFLPLSILLSEEVFQDRYLRKPRISSE
jgi:hypothetical protein